tara:strand:- start:1145 stop:1510 length:366 start_codon:yes stop_codon:yes gene_type:complete
MERKILGMEGKEIKMSELRKKRKSCTPGTPQNRPYGLTIKEAALAVLQDSEPLTIKEIVVLIVERKLFHFNTATPEKMCMESIRVNTGNIQCTRSTGKNDFTLHQEGKIKKFSASNNGKGK